MAAIVFVACKVLKADGLDGNQKIVGVTLLALTLVILGLAALFMGAKPDATTAKDNADKSADARNG